MLAGLFWFCVLIIVYTYVGYPIVLTVLNRFRTHPRSTGESIAELPTVTLLIAAYNEQDVIGEKLENSLALDYPRDRLQILVAADGSNDSTPDVVRGYSDRGVELNYAPPRKGKMSAINRAMSLAWGEIVLFSDANNHYDAGAIKAMVAPFVDPTVGGVTGAKLMVSGDSSLGESEGLYWRYESFVKKQETSFGCCTGYSGEITAIRRELFEAAPENVINDDFYICMRIVRKGYRIVYQPDARSMEKVSSTAAEEVQRRARINAGWFQSMSMGWEVLPRQRPAIVWQVISHKYVRPFLPLAMIGAFVTNLWLAFMPAPATGFRPWNLAPPVGWIMLMLQTAFYLVALFGRGRTQRRGKIGNLLYVPVFLVDSNLAALIGLRRFLTGSQTPLWQRAQRRSGGDTAGTDIG